MFTIFFPDDLHMPWRTSRRKFKRVKSSCESTGFNVLSSFAGLLNLVFRYNRLFNRLCLVSLNLTIFNISSYLTRYFYYLALKF
jgi:hypothetical protein